MDGVQGPHHLGDRRHESDVWWCRRRNGMATATNARVQNVTKANGRLEGRNRTRNVVAARATYVRNPRSSARATWNPTQARTARLAAAAVDAGSKSDAPEPVPEVPLESKVRVAMLLVRDETPRWIDETRRIDTDALASENV